MTPRPPADVCDAARRRLLLGAACACAGGWSRAGCAGATAPGARAGADEGAASGAAPGTVGDGTVGAARGLSRTPPDPDRPDDPDAVAPVVWPTIELLDGTRLPPATWTERPTVVVFWATWCPFCKRHNTRLDRLHRQLVLQAATTPGASAPRVLGVAIDEEAALVRRTVEAQGWRFPMTLDGGRLRPLFTRRRVVPLTCLVDRRGRVLQRIPGEMSDEDVLGLPAMSRRLAG